jgi:hypothetical protein
MGFLEYAWAVSSQKDNVKMKIRMNQDIQQPTLTYIHEGFDIELPVPMLSNEGNILYQGYQFPANDQGKSKVGRLFRASVIHLTTHTLMPVSEKERTKLLSKRTMVETFSNSLVNDTYVNAYTSARYPDRLADAAFANSLAFSRIKPVERIINPATRIMTALISKINIGTIKGTLEPGDEAVADRILVKLAPLKEKIVASFAGEKAKLDEILCETADSITEALEDHGPFVEAPSLPHLEKLGACTVFSRSETLPTFDTEQVFKSSVEILGGKALGDNSVESCWKRESDVEAFQAFDSWFHQKERETRMISKLKETAPSTRFKSMEFPEEDYTQYLRARTYLVGGSRRLLDSLRVAQDALDEDPGKEMGQLDLSAVIQVIASHKPATDVFLLDEYLSRSFAWSVVFDASSSMKVRGELSRAMLICIAEATKELLMDSASWTLFAFSDRLYLLKDSTEAYSRKIRARIGGLKFGGLTYMPDAIQVAGDVVSKRYDEQRFLIVVSDGNPYGYPDIHAALSKTIDALQKKGIIVLGVGIETDKMKEFFTQSCGIYNQRDLIKKFGRIYMAASQSALET